ncbi:MAG TPA: HAMP domain-containing sensor histidine kinase [Candidatus Angelobacter sp.]|nr:HAMP domain-containing sensor histidine kinase [Candidatus Angelobacter sp.]
MRVDALAGDYDQLRAEVEQLLPRAARTPAGVTAAFTAVCARLNRTASPPPAQTVDPVRTIANALIAASGRTATVVLYDRFLQPVLSLPTGLDSAPHAGDTSLRTALTGRRSGAVVLDTPAGPQLAVAFPVAARPGSTCGVAQLSTSTAPIDDVLSSERERLAIGGGIVLVLALLLGLLLTSRALKPLRRVAATARRLAAGDLRARSNLPRSGEVGALASAFDDMADRIEVAFAARAESEARMRRFVADASHELRTPITALKGYIDVIRRGAVRDPQSMDAALETMAREAERMRVLVLDLLTLARLDAQRPMEIGPVDLTEVINAVLDESAHLPGMPDDLQRSVAAAPVVVMADRNALTAIARNLLGNACKYAPGAPQRWTTAVDGTHGVLSVHDDGPGIPAADLPHVFERFYRGEKTRAREEGGSGLGLSIVQGLVTAMGGDVSLQSVDGQGTTITVRLPLAG